MNNESARRLSAIQPSPTMAINARAKELAAAGRKILNLSAGEPDFNTPDFICEAAAQAAAKGETHYTAADGMPELKRAIAGKLERENGLAYAADEIIASCGVKHSLYNACMALVNPGDEVLVPAPYWVSYPAQARLAEAEPRILDCPPENDFKLTPKQLEDAITPKTRLLILNSPNNPSGAVYSRDELAVLGKALEAHDNVMIFTDDIYEHLLYDDSDFVNIVMAAPSLRDRTLVLNGVSKAYAMTGWRLGYAAGPKWLIGAMKKLQSQSTSNPTSLSQIATIAALDGDQTCVRSMRDTFKSRRDSFVAALNEIDGFACKLPPGAFYAFVDCREAMQALDMSDDIEFAKWLLENPEIAGVPGSAFGTPGHIRFSYASDESVLIEAAQRLKHAFD
ncbi:MAG: pyridoxal phosphate-dependent aminotransferase [Gammaproteobacteria bacterium]|nr:pyridoxal phosphate-dependent aminotransferase [Gammaproteobacteria bacterium]